MQEIVGKKILFQELDILDEAALRDLFQKVSTRASGDTAGEGGICISCCARCCADGEAVWNRCRGRRMVFLDREQRDKQLHGTQGGFRAGQKIVFFFFFLFPLMENFSIFGNKSKT